MDVAFGLNWNRQLQDDEEENGFDQKIVLDIKRHMDISQVRKMIRQKLPLGNDDITEDHLHLRTMDYKVLRDGETISDFLLHESERFEVTVDLVHKMPLAFGLNWNRQLEDDEEENGFDQKIVLDVNRHMDISQVRKMIRQKLPLGNDDITEDHLRLRTYDYKDLRDGETIPDSPLHKSLRFEVTVDRVHKMISRNHAIMNFKSMLFWSQLATFF